MSFWGTVAAMAIGSSAPKIIYWASVNSSWYRRWNMQRGYGSTRWSMFAPKWLKRITRKAK